ncbi:MAG: HEAT repeat domain-containing protein [Planctomycetota bacterium]
MKRRLLATLLAIGLVAAGQRCARADVITLEGGGRLAGATAKEQARTTLTLELEGGGRITLRRADVASVVPENEATAEYRRRAPTAPDTVASQWALAKWCQARKLRDAYRRHMRRVVELDPEHAEARTLLGYQRHNGRWLSRDELMAERGLIRYDGDLRTRQEIAILERNKKNKLNNADWKNTLQRWRRALDRPDAERVEEALASYAELTDPAAGPALADQLLEERSPPVKRVLIRAAARVRHPATVQALAKLSLEDASEETRFSCLDHLQRAGTPGLAEPFVRALKSKANETVNRAAAALLAIDARESAAPLVDALVTKHRYQIGEDTGGGQRFSVGGGGINEFGGGGPKIITKKLQNPQVLSALIELTGVNYGYDQAKWRAWLATKDAGEVIDLRRDP